MMSRGPSGALTGHQTRLMRPVRWEHHGTGNTRAFDKVLGILNTSYGSLVYLPIEREHPADSECPFLSFLSLSDGYTFWWFDKFLFCASVPPPSPHDALSFVVYTLGI